MGSWKWFVIYDHTTFTAPHRALSGLQRMAIWLWLMICMRMAFIAQEIVCTIQQISLRAMVTLRCFDTSELVTSIARHGVLMMQPRTVIWMFFKICKPMALIVNPAAQNVKL